MTVKTPKIAQGTWTLLFNVGLFVLACVAVFMVNVFPAYKAALITLVVGILFVNIHCIVRYVFYSSYLENLKKKQNQNIIPRLCPDYWTREFKEDKVICKNEFVVSDNKGLPKIISFGSASSPKEYRLEDLEKMNNQQKCLLIHNHKIPWMDMQTKCETAGQL